MPSFEWRSGGVVCDERKLEGVGVVGNVVGIHFGW